MPKAAFPYANLPDFFITVSFFSIVTFSFLALLQLIFCECFYLINWYFINKSFSNCLYLITPISNSTIRIIFLLSAVLTISSFSNSGFLLFFCPVLFNNQCLHFLKGAPIGVNLVEACLPKCFSWLLNLFLLSS